MLYLFKPKATHSPISKSYINIISSGQSVNSWIDISSNLLNIMNFILKRFIIHIKIIVSTDKPTT